MWWAVAGALAGAYSNSQQKKADKMARNRQFNAYENAKKMTPEESQYLSRLQDRADKGDPNIGKMRNMIYSPIQQNAQFQHQEAQATAIRSGLENSIVADELRRRVNQETLDKIAVESEKLAMYNASYRERQEERVDDFNMQRSQMLRDLALKQDGLPTNSEISTRARGNFASDVIGGASAMNDFGNMFGGGVDVTSDNSGPKIYGSSSGGGSRATNNVSFGNAVKKSGMFYDTISKTWRYR
jgi:hypothetical protein